MAVTPETIAVALGRTAPAADSAEFQQWTMWIADARMLIASRLGNLDDLNQPTLDYVVREAVIAHIKRPDDSTRVEVAVDDGRTAREYRTGRGRVTILDEWWNLLDPKTNAGAFSIRPYGASGGHAPWCDLMYPFKGLDCSCGYSLTLGPWIYEPAEDWA